VKLPPPSLENGEPAAAYLALANGHYDVVTRFALVELSRRGGGSELPGSPAGKRKPALPTGSATLLLSGLAVLLVLLGGLLINRLA
jgi:hypothetical protein